jgi:hypothetical protein
MENHLPQSCGASTPVGFRVSSSGARNIHARSMQACSSPDHSRNGGGIRDCFLSRIQESPLPPLPRPPSRDRRRHNPAIAAEWVLVGRNSPSHPDCRQRHNCRRDSIRHLIRCRRPITPRPSTLGSTDSCRYMTASLDIIQTEFSRSSPASRVGWKRLCAAGKHVAVSGQPLRNRFMRGSQPHDAGGASSTAALTVSSGQLPSAGA